MGMSDVTHDARHDTHTTRTTCVAEDMKPIIRVFCSFGPLFVVASHSTEASRMVISMFASLMLVNSNGGGWYFHGNTEGILGSDADDPDPWCGSDELKCYEKQRRTKVTQRSDALSS